MYALVCIYVLVCSYIYVCVHMHMHVQNTAYEVGLEESEKWLSFELVMVY